MQQKTLNTTGNWVKWLFAFCLFAFLPFHSQAQVKFGYFSYNQALTAMPKYAIAQKNIADLKAQYDAEMKRAEEEFNRKYEEFLEGQREFAPSIRQKRQSELQELMEKNIAFKKDARRLLAAFEKDALTPLHDTLKQVLAKIGQEQGYAFILNTDSDACPYIDPAAGEDISIIVRDALAKQK